MSTLLVVDDIEGIHEMLDIIFENTGITLLHAMLGEQALSLYQEQSVDVVLSDIQMPGMDGLELLQELKKMDPAATVVITTAADKREYVLQALRLGAYDFVDKPYDEDELRSIIGRAIEERQRRLETLKSATATVSDAVLLERDRRIAELEEVLKVKTAETEVWEDKYQELERLKMELEVKEGALATLESVLKERMENLKAARKTQKQEGTGLSADVEAKFAEIQARLEAKESALQELEATLQERELFISQTEESLMDKGMRLQEIETELEQMREDLTKRGGGAPVGGVSAEAMAEFEETKQRLNEREMALAELEERLKERERAVKKAEALVKAREHFLAQSETILFGDDK